MRQQQPKLVGILNKTPDSFSDGGLYEESAAAIARVTDLFYEGASTVDIGAQSTRPGAEVLSVDQEWQRLELLLSGVLPVYPDSISIDTFYPEIVRRSSQFGNFIVNDVTGFNNPEMIETTAELGLSCIVSHLPNAVGQDIQKAHREKEVTSVAQVYDELLTRRDQLVAAGIEPGSIILDPGIGFGKTPEVNWQLLAFAGLVPEHEVMIGYSRKQFLGKDRMNLAVNLEAADIAAESKAAYLRVHDVAGHYEHFHASGRQL